MYYIILLEHGMTVTECYLGYATTLERALECAAPYGATVHETTREGIAKIEAHIAAEAEYLETLRTGLSRRTRGAK